MTQALPIRFQEHLQVREMKVQVISFCLIHILGRNREGDSEKTPLLIVNHELRRWRLEKRSRIARKVARKLKVASFKLPKASLCVCAWSF